MTCALDDAGQAWCWGTNSDGELGADPASLGYSRDPVIVHEGTVFFDVAMGSAVCGITSPNRSTVCWGRNMGGVLGVAEDYCWGIGTYGRLNGDIALTQSATPVLVDLP